VLRYDSSGIEQQRISVPIVWGPKEKWASRIVQDPDFEKKVGFVLPRMGYDLAGISYDSTRHLPTLTKQTKADGDVRAYGYTGVPYNLNFNLYIQTRFIEDGDQILEQILPYFSPSYTLEVNTLDEQDVTDQISFTLSTVNQTLDYEGDFEKVRVCMWTLTFTARIRFYGPTFTQGLIREVIIDLHVGSGATPFTAAEAAETPRNVRITSVPDPIDANPEDVWVPDTTIEEFDDGKKFDPTTGNDVPV
jgi:hypothetical protein